MIRLTLFPYFSVTSKQQELHQAEEHHLLTLEVQQVDPVMAMAREEVITTGAGGIPEEVSSLMMDGVGNNSPQEVKEATAGAGLLRTQTDTDKVE